MSVGSNNSCANSVCSVSSSFTPDTTTNDASLPREVMNHEHHHQQQSLLSTTDDSTGIHNNFKEEEEVAAPHSQSSLGGATDLAIQQLQAAEKDFLQSENTTPVEETEEPPSVKSQTSNNEDNATVNSTEGESTSAETPLLEPEEKEQSTTTEQLEEEQDNATEENVSTEEEIRYNSANSSIPASKPATEEKKSDDDDNDDKEEDVFYDVLPSVQPSSYNPFAATVPLLLHKQQQQQQELSAEEPFAAYSTLNNNNKPTTPLLVAAQSQSSASLLMIDAIVEEEGEEEEEPSFDDNDGNANDDDMDANLIHIGSIDEVDCRTRPVQEIVAAAEIISVEEQDSLNVSRDDDDDDDDESFKSSQIIEEDDLPDGTDYAAIPVGVTEPNSEEPIFDEKEEEKPEEDVEVSPVMELASLPQASLAEMDRMRDDIRRLEQSNAELLDNIRLAGEREEEQETVHLESVAASKQQMQQLDEVRAGMSALENTNDDLLQKLQEAEVLVKEQESNNAEAAVLAKEQTEKLQQAEETAKDQEETNIALSDTLKLAAHSLETQQAKNADTVASSAAQAEMMSCLGEELKQLEETNTELQQKLKEAEEAASVQTARNVVAATATDQASEKLKELGEEIQQLNEKNASLLDKIRLSEEREKAQTSRDESVTLAYVGDMPVDVGRLRIQCQKYFRHLRIAQMKSHCVKDKSPASFSVTHNPKARQTIDFQALLDKGAAIESQDTTYMFRPLDTFNKGHFHTHKLLIPWKISSSDGKSITRSEFFSQVWQQLANLTVTVGEKKTVIPLFQDCLGTLIPMPNAVLEGKLQCTPAELERTFSARIAPYYRAIGRLMVQCIGATADDTSDYSLKIAGHAMPPILRHKLFRGVDPTDSSYPMDQLLDHAFSLLGMNDMTEGKAFEYFGIDIRNCLDKSEATTKVRIEIHEMWIKERSLALQALEEGLSLNGLADVSFCCGLVPLEAVDEILFSL